MSDICANVSRRVMATDWRGTLRRDMPNEKTIEMRDLFGELNPHLAHSPLIKSSNVAHRAAAVLIPIIDHADEPTVLFTLRSSEMPSHAGQISFPGGRVHPEDPSMRHTALRETEEEVGIPMGNVDVIGEFGAHLGGRGFAVTPVVGIIPPSTVFTPCQREVADIFEVPLSFLMDTDNHIIDDRMESDVEYKMYAMPYAKWHIWGLTAGILNSLSQVLSKPVG